MQNPFTLTFGKSPNLSVARPEQVNQILDAFTEDNINQPLFMITGIRGSGKTVMMSEIANQIDKMDNWITVELNPTTDILKNLLSKLYSNSTCLNIIVEAKINLSFFGLGVTMSGDSQITDAETAVIRVLEALKKKNKRVLILIDEAINNDNMRIFSSSFQIFVRRELPVCLLMTGLYENIDDLQNEKNLTFLYRAPKVTPKPLGKMAMARKYHENIKISEEAARRMAELTKGYPFAFQVLGYLTWENKGDYDGIMAEYSEYLEDYVYDKLWSELSQKDIEVLAGIARCDTGRVKDIRELLDMTTNEFNPYRKRLIKKGILNGTVRGYVDFDIPLFREYILMQTSDD